MLFAGTLAAQTPVPEWQAGVDKVKSLVTVMVWEVAPPETSPSSF